MIGGRDFVVNAPWDAAARTLVEGMLREHWPSMVADDDTDAGEHYFYRDELSWDSWNRDGLTDENDDAMLCVIAGGEQFTLVTSTDPASFTAGIGEELVRKLGGREVRG